MRTWIVGLAILVLSQAAAAADHRMKVGEVMLSNGGTDVQFIELWDTNPSGESFPKSTYQVSVYDSAGSEVGTVAIGGPLGTTTRYFIASAMATAEYGTETDATLTFVLPAVGQACFDGAPGSHIHCLAWGCPATVISASSNSQGEAPGDNQSLSIDELTPNGGNDSIYAIAVPTPNEPNAVGTESAACPVPDAAPNGSAPDASVDDPDPASPDAGRAVGERSDGGCSTGGGGSDGALLLLLLAAAVARSRKVTPA